MGTSDGPLIWKEVEEEEKRKEKKNVKEKAKNEEEEKGGGCHRLLWVCFSGIAEGGPGLLG